MVCDGAGSEEITRIGRCDPKEEYRRNRDVRAALGSPKEKSVELEDIHTTAVKCYEVVRSSERAPITRGQVCVAHLRPHRKRRDIFCRNSFWKTLNASHQGASVCSTFDPEMKVATPNRALGEVN